MVLVGIQTMSPLDITLYKKKRRSRDEQKKTIGIARCGEPIL